MEELLAERGLAADHTTIWRWVQRYAPELEQRLGRHLKPTNKSWRVDETYIKVNGLWCYLYRAVDSVGATIDFLQSTQRDVDAAKWLLSQRLERSCASSASRHQHRLAPIYSSAIPAMKKEGLLCPRCRHRPFNTSTTFWSKITERSKRRVNAKQGFREFGSARRTIRGYEAIHMIRKGQARRVSGSDDRCQIQFIEKLFELTA